MKKRVRSVPIYVWVRPDELEVIRERMAEAGIRNMSAYIRKMALGGYVLHVDLEPVKELVSLQRRCANNLNQAAIHANSYGGLYPDELKRLQKDYADLWGPLSDLLAQLSAIVTMSRLSLLLVTMTRSKDNRDILECRFFPEL